MRPALQIDDNGRSSLQSPNGSPEKKPATVAEAPQQTLSIFEQLPPSAMPLSDRKTSHKVKRQLQTPSPDSQKDKQYGVLPFARSLFGTRSKTRKSKQRKISKIAPTPGSQPANNIAQIITSRNSP